jgi:hypothetical protein
VLGRLFPGLLDELAAVGANMCETLGVGLPSGSRLALYGLCLSALKHLACGS